MKYIPDKTICIHKKFGKGVYKRHDGQCLIVEFSTGEVMLSTEIIDKGLMTIHNDEESPESNIIKHNSSPRPLKKLVQPKALTTADGFYEIDDTEQLICGNKMWEFDGEHDKLSFNSTFYIFGQPIKGTRLRATYDLVVMGDLHISEVIEIKGSLAVFGNIEAGSITVGNEFNCSGKVVAKNVEVGKSIFVQELQCDDVICDGNIVVERNIYARNSIKVAHAILSGGGIFSDDIFSHDTVAVDFIESYGECVGNKIDLSISSVPVIEQRPQNSVINNSGEGLRDLDYRIIKEIARSLQNEYGSNLKDTINYLQRISKLEVSKLCDMYRSYQYLADIIELKSISNLRDYIVLQYCKKNLMLELLSNPIVRQGIERLDVIPSSDVQDMEFSAKNLNEFILCLKIVVECVDIFGNMQETILDKIFQSIGIKYGTVKRFLSAN